MLNSKCDLVPSSWKPLATKRGGWRGVSELTSTSSKLNILQFLARLMPKKSQDVRGKYKTHCTAFVDHTTSDILHFNIKRKVHSGQGYLSISAQPYTPLLLIYLILLWSLQDSYSKPVPTGKFFSSWWCFSLSIITLKGTKKKKRSLNLIVSSHSSSSSSLVALSITLLGV